MSTTSITLPLHEALTAFKSVLPHASTDDITPIITALSIVSTDDKTGSHLVATDRYSVGRYELSVPIGDLAEGVVGFLVPRQAASWITRLTFGVLRYGKESWAQYRVRITQAVDDEKPFVREVTVALIHGQTEDVGLGYPAFHEDAQPEQLRVFDGLGGNFPPVLRLFPDETTKLGVERLALSPWLISRIATSIVAATGKKTDPGHFTFTAATSGKPGPVMVEAGKLSMLIQPNSMIR